MGRITTRWMVGASYRFNKLSGRFGGLVSAIIDPFSYMKLFEKQIGADIEYAILDHMGLVYFHSKGFFKNKKAAFGSYSNQADLFPELNRKFFELSLFPFEDPSLQSLYDVPGYENFYVLTKINRSMADEKWNEQLISLFILYLCFIAASYYYFITMAKKGLGGKRSQAFAKR